MLKKFKQFFEQIFLDDPRNIYETCSFQIGERVLQARRLTPTDVDALFELEGVVYNGEYPWTKNTFLAELHSRALKLYIGIFDEELLRGFIGCRIVEQDAHITNVAVDSEWQGLGLGSWMIDEVEKFAIMCGCETMSLEVRISNKAAQRLYRRKGFVSRAVKYEYYDENNEDALDMVKYL